MINDTNVLPRQFDEISQYKWHIRKHEPKEKKNFKPPPIPEPCIACGAAFKTEKTLKSHIAKLGPYHDNICTYPSCKIEFTSWNEHKDHLDINHGGIFQFKCGFCLGIFASEIILRYHHNEFCESLVITNIS